MATTAKEGGRAEEKKYTYQDRWRDHLTGEFPTGSGRHPGFLVAIIQEARTTRTINNEVLSNLESLCHRHPNFLVQATEAFIKATAMCLRRLEQGDNLRIVVHETNAPLPKKT